MQEWVNPGLTTSQADSLSRSVRSLEARLQGANRGGGNPRKEELRRAAEEFESLFVAHLLKVMRETLNEATGPEGGGFGKTIYTELFDQEVARTIAQRGSLGIADLLMRSFRDDESPATGDTKLPAAPPAVGESPALPSSSPAIVTPRAKRPVPDDSEEIPDTMMPVNAPVSSGFGFRSDPFTRQLRFHKGLDLAAPEGTPVQAVADGEVAFAGYRRGFGNSVVIKHADGLETRYAHLGTVSVRTGETVGAQQAIGEVGSSGRFMGPHLHFEVMRWGSSIDPRTATPTRSALSE